MTNNQIAYWTLQENQRANRMREHETGRHNLAQEQETARSNLASETERGRSNLATETENERYHNLLAAIQAFGKTGAVPYVFGSRGDISGAVKKAASAAATPNTSSFPSGLPSGTYMANAIAGAAPIFLPSSDLLKQGRTGMKQDVDQALRDAEVALAQQKAAYRRSGSLSDKRAVEEAQKKVNNIRANREMLDQTLSQRIATGLKKTFNKNSN